MDIRVKRLEIEGFRGLDNLTVEFSYTEPMVLIGVNGVEKSSILDCLRIFLSLSHGILYDAKSQKRLVHLAEFQIALEAREKIHFNEQDIKRGSNRVVGKIFIELNGRKCDWSLIQERNSVVKYDCTNSLIEVIRSIPFQQLNFPLIIYYPVTRGVFEVPLELLEESKIEQTSAYKDALQGSQANFKTFFQWFRTVEDLENEERRDNSEYRDRRLESVRNAISQMLPGFKNLRVRRSPLRMTVAKDGEELIINQLSDGEKCLLAMVGDIARRLAILNPGLEDPLQGSGVVLIDEIELHLHPAWQRRIIPTLTQTFPNCQFIVTTHSPQVVSHVKPEGIFLLEKTPQGITARHPESSYGRDSNRILEDLMGVPKRPQDIKEELLELFRPIDSGELDAAREVRQKLASQIGNDEPEFAKADVLIRRKEILNR